MSASAKVALAGIGIALVVLVAGNVGLRGAAEELEDARAECALEAENAGGRFSGNLVCDSSVLRSLGELQGVQEKVVAADRLVNQWRAWPLPLALGLLAILGLPYAWQFLLRRVREVSLAVRGE